MAGWATKLDAIAGWVTPVQNTAPPETPVIDQTPPPAAAEEHAVDAGPQSTPWVLEYDRLRQILKALWLAPEKDMPAIASVMKQLDDTHAAFKAQHKADDHQRY